MTDKDSGTEGAGQTPSDQGVESGKGQGLWGGRFERKPAELMQAINVSIAFDKRLWAQDLAGSRAHCAMLAKQGVISPADAAEIQGGLKTIEAEIKAGTFAFRASSLARAAARRSSNFASRRCGFG